MFFKYQVPVTAYRRDNGVFVFDFLWTGKARSKTNAELQALKAAAAVAKSDSKGLRFSLTYGGTKRLLTPLSKALIGLSLAACATLAAFDAKADTRANAIAETRADKGRVLLTAAPCSHAGEKYRGLRAARFVFDDNYTEHGCFFIDPKTAEVVVFWLSDGTTFSYPARSFRAIK